MNLIPPIYWNIKHWNYGKKCHIRNSGFESWIERKTIRYRKYYEINITKKKLHGNVRKRCKNVTLISSKVKESGAFQFHHLCDCVSKEFRLFQQFLWLLLQASSSSFNGGKASPLSFTNGCCNFQKFIWRCSNLRRQQWLLSILEWRYEVYKYACMRGWGPTAAEWCAWK